MKLFFSVLILSLFLQITNAQQFVLVDSISTENKLIKSIETDLNNSIYLISDTKVEKLYQHKKPKLIDFKSIITSVDTGNPLRFYIYSNFNRLSILDEDLNPIQDPVIISSTDYIPSALKVADNQFCWFYDMMNNKIVYYNYQIQKTILHSKQVFLKNNDQSIETIYVFKNTVYLKGKNTIYVYDDYGNLKTNFSIEVENSPYHFYKNALFYSKNNKLYSLNLENQNLTSLIDLKETKSIAMNETNFYSFNGRKIYIYTVN